MCHYFRFLLSADESDQLLSQEFYREFNAALPKCDTSATVNLYTTPDYRDRILNEKLQRLILECSEEALPALDRLLNEFPGVEVDPPEGDSLFCLIGTSKLHRPGKN